MARRNRFILSFGSGRGNTMVVDLPNVKPANEVKKIKVQDSEGNEVAYGTPIEANKEYHYYVESFTREEAPSLENDKTKVRWCYWLDKTQEKLDTDYFEIVDKEEIPESEEDFLLQSQAEDETTQQQENCEAILNKGILYACKTTTEITVNGETKEMPILKVKFSKWLDGEKLKVEARIADFTINSKHDSVATRGLNATPEIAEVYWTTKDGERIERTGYSEEIYMHLVSLGLQGKTIEGRIYEQDHDSDTQMHEGDNIEWKNNRFKIEGRTFKRQFKVGSKEAHQKSREEDVQNDNGSFFTYLENMFGDPNKEALELKFEVANASALSLDETLSYGALSLSLQSQVVDAYFAKIEQETIALDAPMTDILSKKKKKIGEKNTKGKVRQHEKLESGVIGQKIKLIAECDNINGEKVVFQLFEKSPLLTDADTALKFVHEGKEVDKVEVEVKDGYAVTEVELKKFTENTKNDDWVEKLFDNSVKKHSDIKSSEIFVEVTQGTNSKDFQDQTLKLTTNTCACGRCNDYQDVKPNPVLNHQTYKNKNRFKKAKRVRKSGKIYYHRGTDILAPTNTDVHSLLCGKVANFGYRKSFKTNEYAANSFGNTIVIESYDKTGKKIYIKYCHLDSISVNIGDYITHGQIIAKSGSTGNAATILYTEGVSKGKLKNGIKKEYRHIHIEASRSKAFPNSRIGSENDPETYMKTKFDEDGN